MNDYLRFRGEGQGPLFLLFGKPITYDYISNKLEKITSALNLQHNEELTSHCFRIGRCTDWVKEGLSQDQITELSQKLQLIIDDIETKEMRWFELAEKLGL